MALSDIFAAVTSTPNAIPIAGADGKLDIDWIPDLSAVYEPYLGLPAADGYVLSSTAAGVRSWIAPGENLAVILKVASLRA